MAKQSLNREQTNYQAIQISMSASQSIGTGNTDINFNTTDWTIGTAFTRSGTTIVIGAGVSFIRLTFNVMTESSGGTSYLYSNIHKNGVEQSQTIDAAPSAGFRSTTHSRIIPVVQGDIVKVVSSSGAGTQTIRSGVATFVLVERVA